MLKSTTDPCRGPSHFTVVSDVTGRPLWRLALTLVLTVACRGMPGEIEEPPLPHGRAPQPAPTEGVEPSTESPEGPLGTLAAPLTCDSPGLVWKTANKTNYTSYPKPGSEECVKYSGCLYQGLFSVCGDRRKSKAWVMSHNIAAFFPLKKMGLHNLCLKSGNKTIEVTVYDTCGDSDCDGCCTENKGSAEALIDLESFTNKRFGVRDGRIQWADLGKKGASCND
jgi:hypothetical protein